jgi:hypothetical protein
VKSIASTPTTASEALTQKALAMAQCILKAERAAAQEVAQVAGGMRKQGRQPRARQRQDASTPARRRFETSSFTGPGVIGSLLHSLMGSNEPGSLDCSSPGHGDPVIEWGTAASKFACMFRLHTISLLDHAEPLAHVRHPRQHLFGIETPAAARHAVHDD